ncbi:MAG: hypothetical protein IBX44_10010 [Sulfurospirillum sp.]|nr:hypothetical protein [Sulfurospirillum sp.]
MARNLCLLVCAATATLASESFWFSYQITTTNQIMTSEERNISPAMMQQNSLKQYYLCKIPNTKKPLQTSLDFLNNTYETLLECFYPEKSRIAFYSQIQTQGMLEENELTILPQRFTVDFKDEFAIINTLK